MKCWRITQWPGGFSQRYHSVNAAFDAGRIAIEELGSVRVEIEVWAEGKWKLYGTLT